jgi:hypothetical protein
MKAFTPALKRRTAPVSVGNLILFLGRAGNDRLLVRAAHCVAQAIEERVEEKLETPLVRKGSGPSSASERRCAIMRRFMASSKGGFVKTHDDEVGAEEENDDGSGS